MSVKLKNLPLSNTAELLDVAFDLLFCLNLWSHFLPFVTLTTPSRALVGALSLWVISVPQLELSVRRLW